MELGGEEGPEDQESEDEAEGLKTDAMIKVSTFRAKGKHLLMFLFTGLVSLQQKKTKPSKESTKAKKEESGKGKGKGKGKAKK